MPFLRQLSTMRGDSTKKAAHHARTASGRALHARHLSDEAAKAHVEEHVARMADWSRRRNPPLDGNEEAGYGSAYNPPYELRAAG